MADQVKLEDFAFNLEAEHLFADSLWSDPEIGPFLEEMGYKKNALGNLMIEFADAETVEKINALPEDHPLKKALLDSQSKAGTVRHKGNASGGSQFGKNAFLREEILEIKQSGATAEVKQIAIDNLFDWVRRLGKGEILGVDGRPLGVMGNTEFAETLSSAYREGTGPLGSPKAYVDPLDLANPDNLPPEERAAVERARATSVEVRQYWAKPENSVEFSDGSGKFNGRGALAKWLIKSYFDAGLISAQSYNDKLIELGKGTNSSAA